MQNVSLHIHERIDPARIVKSFLRSKKQRDAEAMPLFASLFDEPENDLPLNKAVDFYSHEQDWTNRLIAGDSLLVMNSLLVKEGMAGKVQMVYFDPPYGIKYNSNFQPFVNKRDVKDGNDADIPAEPEMIQAFRDTWELGIHSYLTYLRDRLVLSRELLADSGSVFVQISDENVHHVREICDEVFGRENFVSLIAFQKTGGFSPTLLSNVSDYMIWYGKDISKIKYRTLYKPRHNEEVSLDGYLIQDGRNIRSLSKEEKLNPSDVIDQIFQSVSLESGGWSESGSKPFLFKGKEYTHSALFLCLVDFY